MGLFGDLLSLPFRVVNAPIRVLENIAGDDPPEDERILSKPLDAIADEIEKIDD